MDEQKQIFVVSTGDYSDYGVVCVCATKEIADEVARRYDLGWQNSPQYRKRPHLNKHEVEAFDFVESADDYVPDPGLGAVDSEGT